MVHTSNSDSYTRLEYGIKSEETRRKYVRRIELFFDFYKVGGKTMNDRENTNSIR
jgi:hypothetical protein